MGGESPPPHEKNPAYFFFQFQKNQKIAAVRTDGFNLTAVSFFYVSFAVNIFLASCCTAGGAAKGPGYDFWFCFKIFFNWFCLSFRFKATCCESAAFFCSEMKRLVLQQRPLLALPQPPATRSVFTRNHFGVFSSSFSLYSDMRIGGFCFQKIKNNSNNKKYSQTKIQHLA